MAKQAYLVENDIVTSLKELASKLGVSRVSSKDLEEGGKFADKVTILSAEDVENMNSQDTSAEEPVEEAEETTTDVEEPTEESDEEWEDKNPIRLKKEEPAEDEPHPMEREDEGNYSALDEDEEVDAEEVKSLMPDFESLDELKSFIKDIDTPTLEYMAKGLGLTWKPTDHKNIHRMRVAMSMHEHFFPAKKKSKAESAKGGKYKDYSTDDLKKLLEDNNIEYKEYEDESITRMRMIMALKKNDLIPQ